MKIHNCYILLLSINLVCSDIYAQQTNNELIVGRVVFKDWQIFSYKTLFISDMNLISNYYGFNAKDSIINFISKLNVHSESNNRSKFILYIIGENKRAIISKFPLMDIDKYFTWNEIAKSTNELDDSFSSKWWYDELKNLPTKVIEADKMKN